MRRFAIASVLSAALALAALGAPALAHEQRAVGGYQLTIGWQHEPTYTGVENAVQLIIKDAKGNPVDDIGDPPTVVVQVINGSKTSDPLVMTPSFDADTGLGTHGEFDGAIVPTTPGDYTFHVTGTLGGQKIDEKFTSSDKTFDPVKDPSEVQFPVKQPAPAQLATSVGRLEGRIADGRDKASRATTLAIAALVVGGVLGLAGIAVGVSARRRG